MAMARTGLDERLSAPISAFHGDAYAMFADIGGSAPGEAVERWLDRAERERAGQFRTRALRDRFLNRRALLRVVLAEATGSPPDTLQLQVDQAGRLHLPDGPDFNASSSHDVALIAVAPAGSRIGADIERCDEHADLDGIARSIFSSGERAWMSAAPDPRHAFYRLWTLKEAYLKATGDGLAHEPWAAEIDPERRRADAPARPGAALEDLAAPPGFAAALALLDAR